MFRSRSVSLALVGLFVWVTGCASYTQIGVDEVADYGKVRVTKTDGGRETVYDPRVEADSIRGRFVEGDQPRTADRAICLDEVAELDAVGTNAGGTVLVVLGSALLVLTLVAAAASASECSQGGMLC